MNLSQIHALPTPSTGATTKFVYPKSPSQSRAVPVVELLVIGLLLLVVGVRQYATSFTALRLGWDDCKYRTFHYLFFISTFRFAVRAES